MADFDIEETKKQLEGSNIQEKLEKLDSLIADLEDEIQNLEDAIDEVMAIRNKFVDEYKASVYDLATVKSIVENKKWDEKISIDRFRNIVVNYESNKAILNVRWDNNKWSLNIRLMDFIANDSHRHQLYELAEALNLPYKSGDDEIRVIVEEGAVQPTVLRIITDLVEKGR